jgi:hypothetical protein
LTSFGGIKGKFHHDERVGQSLNTQTNGTMTHVALSRSFSGVKVDVNDLVEIFGDRLSNFKQLLVIKCAGLGIDKFGLSMN